MRWGGAAACSIIPPAYAVLVSREASQQSPVHTGLNGQLKQSLPLRLDRPRALCDGGQGEAFLAHLSYTYLDLSVKTLTLYESCEMDGADSLSPARP